MASPARHAFAPLQSFIEAASISRTVQIRANTLYTTARSRTGLGSGNELPTNVAGNANAIAAACLMLAQIEAEGQSQVDQDAYQRKSSLSKPLFKKLVVSLQGVLPLKGGITAGTTPEAKKTPTRSSARKRTAEAASLDNDEDPQSTTPTKASARTSSRASTSISASASKAAKSTTTPTRSARSSRVEELASGQASGSTKARLEDDIDDHTGSVSEKSPSRRSSRVSSSSVVNAADKGKGRANPTIVITPTKKSKVAAVSNAREQSERKEAFEAALRTTTTPTKPSTIASGSAKKPKFATVAIPVLREAEREEAEEEEPDVPYEAYTDDLLRRWRTKLPAATPAASVSAPSKAIAPGGEGDGEKDKKKQSGGRENWWEAVKGDMESWREEMLERLEVAELVA